MLKKTPSFLSVRRLERNKFIQVLLFRLPSTFINFLLPLLFNQSLTLRIHHQLLQPLWCIQHCFLLVLSTVLHQNAKKYLATPKWRHVFQTCHAGSIMREQCVRLTLGDPYFRLFDTSKLRPENHHQKKNYFLSLHLFLSFPMLFR